MKSLHVLYIYAKYLTNSTTNKVKLLEPNFVEKRLVKFK